VRYQQVRQSHTITFMRLKKRLAHEVGFASAYEVGPVKVFVAWLDTPISTSTRSGLVLFTYRCTT
jgi:hypothetical protein